MDQQTRNRLEQLPDTIRHRRAFRAWYEAGRKVDDSVTEAADKARVTIYQWRDAENWEAVADELDRRRVEAMAREYEQGATEARAKSAALVNQMLANAALMNTKLGQAIIALSADAQDIQATARYSDSAISNAARVYNWETLLKVEVNDSPEVEAIKRRLYEVISANPQDALA